MSLPAYTGALPKTPMDSPAKNTVEGSWRAHQNPAKVNVAPESGGDKIAPRKKRWNQNKRRDKKKQLGDVPDPTEKCDPPPAEDVSEPVKIVNENFYPAPPASQPGRNQSAKPAPYVEKPYPPSMQGDSAPPAGALLLRVPAPADRFTCDQNYIEIFKTRCEKHPRAQFQCKLCSYYCDNMTVVIKHVNDKRHLEAMKCRQLETTIARMPGPSPGQLSALTALVQRNHMAHGLTREDRETRRAVARRLDAVVRAALPAVSVRPYGSTETCLGLRRSDLNLDLVVPPGHALGPAKTMLAVADLLGRGPDGFSLVACDLRADMPAVVAADDATQLQCTICLSGETAHEVTRLLACYEELDERVGPLAAMLRMWAAECLLDKVELGTWPPYAFSLMLVYYLQQMANPVLPVLHCLVDNPRDDPTVYLRPHQLGDLWQCKNTASLGELWLGFFRFYVNDFAITERIVCIQQLDPLLRSTKKWGGRKLAIEDPFISKRNVSKTIVNMVTFDFVLHCFRTSYLYYAVPQLKAGPLFGAVDNPVDPATYGPECEAALKRQLAAQEALLDGPEFSTPTVAGQPCPPGQCHPDATVTPKIAQEMLQRFDCTQLCYVTRKEKFWGTQVLPMVCISCSNEGHLKSQCPEQTLPPAVRLPPMTDQMIGYLNEVCTSTFRKLSPTDEEIRSRQAIVNELEAFLMESDPEIKLDLFGSSCNGFGLVRSDLDICLTFRHDPTGDTLNFARIVEDITAKCRKYREFSSLVAILTAKVPILKFAYNSADGLEGDISVYNTLAQRNTKMLRAYATIDVRVRMLGFMMKKFAKMCDICDASRGSLSSYAYILMVIYFLQQCDPPVLPVLQELWPPGTEPTPVIVDKINTYFYEDVEHIADVWPGVGLNTTPVGLLWHQLLCFYAEGFSFTTEVVSIRQAAKLTRFEKLWNNRSIAIEDPFDVTHNLGAGLSIKMNTFIMKTFLRGREHFGYPVLLPDKLPVSEYFFSRRNLVDGAPPNDRGCRVCKKIGHQVKDCPIKKSATDWRQQKRAAANNQQPHPEQLEPPRGGPRGQRQRAGPPVQWKNENARYAGGAPRQPPHGGGGRHMPPGLMNGALHPAPPPGLGYAPAMHARGNPLLEQRLNAQGHRPVSGASQDLSRFVQGRPVNFSAGTGQGYHPSQDVPRLEQSRHANVLAGPYQRSNW